MKLTNTQIRGLEPRTKLYRVNDGDGLLLEVTPAGRKLWRLRYQWGGKEQMISLGTYPTVALREARDRRFELKRNLASGVNPKTQVRKGPALQKAIDQSLFRNVALEWLEARRHDARPKTFQKMDTILKSDLIPRLGDTSVATLPTPVAVNALREIQARAPHMAQKAMTYLNQIILYAIQRGLREDGRSLSLKGVVRLPKATSVPAATDNASLKQVMQAVAAHPDRLVQCALLMTAYTALRPGNVVGLTWAMLQDAGAVLHIPGELMKTGEEHFVPLPRQALAIVAEARSWPPRRRDYIFPPISQRATPHLHRDTLSKALRDMGLQGKHVPHGFRAAFRSRAREVFNADVDLLETQLAHSKGDATARAYDRTRFLAERAKVMQEWADYLDRLSET